jgi:ATP-dependent protease ClpP protease subunit
MNETQKALLEKGIVVLPNHINHEVYEYVLEALMLRPEQIVMYCKGDGGDVSSALAIVDLIQQHGHVVGMLPGEANSSHATIFSGCSERYVFPNGVIGVHQIAWDSHNGRLDSHNLRLLSVDFDAADAQIAWILAAASNKSRDWWYKVLRDTGSGGVTQYRAGQMIQLGLARDVAEWKPSPPAPLPHGEGSENGRREKPMVTVEQVEQLKALGYVVIDLNDNPSGAQVRGPQFHVTRQITAHENMGIFNIGHSWIIADAWKKAFDHAVNEGLITDNKASEG